jgi:hypothetical protein
LVGWIKLYPNNNNKIQRVASPDGDRVKVKKKRTLEEEASDEGWRILK